MTLAERLSDLGPERIRPLRRAEVEEMVRHGLLVDERVELLCGVLVEMSPQDPPHAGVVGILTEFLVRALAGRAHVRIKAPLAASDDSLPEPDVAVVPPGDYRRAHPSTAALVVEVADSSLRKDRLVKAELYAAAGVTEYWIVNLRDRVLEVHTRPGRAGYEERRSFHVGDAVALQAFPDVTISVADLVG